MVYTWSLSALDALTDKQIFAAPKTLEYFTSVADAAKEAFNLVNQFVGSELVYQVSVCDEQGIVVWSDSYP